MYIRRTTTKKAVDGTPYATFRLVESRRVNGKPRQFTLLSLGSNFDLSDKLWPELCRRIQDLLSGREVLLPSEPIVEEYARNLAARFLAENSVLAPAAESLSDAERYQEVDVTSVKSLELRSVGVEHISLHAVDTLQLSDILEKVGFTPSEVSAALASIVGRMAMPSSENKTWCWLLNRSAIGELLNEKFSGGHPSRLYRVSDKLIRNKQEIETLLFDRIRSLFSLDEAVVLYDLTNTYFEGQAEKNSKAAFGHSKEKRKDSPLVTLGLVLDGSGFVKRSEVFRGNVSEATTVQEMLEGLQATENSLVVMDRGTATAEVLAWLKQANYRYVVVSREQGRTFDFDKAQTIKSASDQAIQVYIDPDPKTGETRLYCYSALRAAKEMGIHNRFAQQFEEELRKLNDGLKKPRTIKQRDKVLKRIGRMEAQSKGVSQHYVITVTDNADTKTEKQPLNATSVTFEKKVVQGTSATHAGVYCIRTNAEGFDAESLWKTYVMLTDLEAVFRSLKSELGLRPVWHQTTERVDGHLFITVLAYQCVQVIRKQLKMRDISMSWTTLRDTLSTHQRLTTTFRQRNGKTLHIRKASEAESQHLRIYNALNISHSPGEIKQWTTS